MILLNNTFVNEKSQLVGVPIWVSMGMLNFVLAILIVIQASIVISVQKWKYIVFPLSRTNSEISFVLFLFASVTFFTGMALSRSSMTSFSASGVALMAIFIALIPGTGWFTEVSSLANNEALLSRVMLMLGSLATLTAVMTSPSTFTRLIMITFMTIILMTTVLMETHYMVVPDLDTPESSSLKNKK